MGVCTLEIHSSSRPYRGPWWRRVLPGASAAAEAQGAWDEQVGELLAEDEEEGEGEGARWRSFASRFSRGRTTRAAPAPMSTAAGGEAAAEVEAEEGGGDESSK